MIPLRWVRLSPPRAGLELERELGVYVHAADLLYLLDELGPGRLADELGALLEQTEEADSGRARRC